MEKDWKILVLNLGSTSSKVAFCVNEHIAEQQEWAHDAKELKALETPESVIAYRKRYVQQFLEEHAIDMSQVDAIAVRGTGRPGSYRHGAYLLTPQLGEDARNGKAGHQGLFSSTVIGDELSREYGIPAYLYDVVPTDEICDVARICGIPNYRRIVHSHTLNSRATARKVALEMGLSPDGCTFIICHMGGGCGTACYRDGVIIDTYSSEEGGFSPIRAGRVPADFLEKIYQDPQNTPQDIRRLLRKEVGLYGHLGTDDCREVERRIEAGDPKAKLVYQAMAYQFSKDIAAMSSVVCGKVDAIILTGGIAHSRMITGWIADRVGFIAPVKIVPGSMELQALAGGVVRVLNGEEQVNDYSQVTRR
ncbi:MAG: butyrate kinase [Oscillospiraceae bacterium]|nr:butyrate kinase [Oscillospiraceae bacterium]